MNNEQEKMQEKAKKALSNMLQLASDAAKKAASEVQKSATAFSEKRQQEMLEKQIKKYRPLTAKEYKSKNFKIPNAIQIVDDAVRRNIEVCEGAIGWLEEHKGVEVLHLYDEFVEKSGLSFVPAPKCDTVYCVDNFDRSTFISSSYVFSKTNEEKLAELANIAHSLGAKRCSVEIVESDTKSSSGALGINIAVGGANANVAESNKQKSSGKRTMEFIGSDQPTRPELKWFAYDENIKGLIEMRCSNNNSIKSTTLELSGSSCATMSKKVACAIDHIAHISGSASMEAQAMCEHSSKLILEIEF